MPIKVETPFKSPNSHPGGHLAKDEGLWRIDQGTDRVQRVSDEGSSLVLSLQTESYRPGGITFSGGAGGFPPPSTGGYSKSHLITVPQSDPFPLPSPRAGDHTASMERGEALGLKSALCHDLSTRPGRPVGPPLIPRARKQTSRYNLGIRFPLVR